MLYASFIVRICRRRSLDLTWRRRCSARTYAGDGRYTIRPPNTNQYPTSLLTLRALIACMRALETSLANPHTSWSDLFGDIGHRSSIRGIGNGSQGGDGNRRRRLSGSRRGRVGIVVVGLQRSRSRHRRRPKGVTSDTL